MRKKQKAGQSVSFEDLISRARKARSQMGEEAWRQYKKEQHEKYLASLIEGKRELDAFVNSPEGKAREALQARLEELRSDSVISQSETCIEVLEAFIFCLTYRWGAKDAAAMIEPLGEHFATVQAVTNAQTRHEPSKKAKTFVQSEWKKHRSAYENNKSAFARDYVSIVANKFQNTKGEPLKITEKQMREVWLKDSRPASKQAGKLASG